MDIFVLSLFVFALTLRVVFQGRGVDAVWTQDTSTVTVGVVISDNIRGKDVDLIVHPGRMKLTLGDKTALEGTFDDRVVPDGSFFSIESKRDKRMCVITLEKKEIGHESWMGFFEEDQLDTSVTCKVRACVLVSSLHVSRIWAT
jgi:hypothetical protein